MASDLVAVRKSLHLGQYLRESGPAVSCLQQAHLVHQEACTTIDRFRPLLARSGLFLSP